MRKVIQAFWLFMCTVLISVQTAQAANPSAANIFGSIGGTTTIDRGGALHSQARSIYSLGGGMTTFEGKRVSLLAADPPSFSAGCNGISWHFGGFAFISLDEIRQLVEAVAQASLGIAVDLAMQTLCPQCYAVMAKLRDMSNMMRNAAADACKIAQNFGAMLQEKGVFSSTGRASSCSQITSEAGKTSSYLDSWAGSACRNLESAEKELGAAADKVTDFLKFGNADANKTPDRAQLDAVGNVTYKSLSALGYEDGVIKDVMLSLLGMTIVHPKADVDCRSTFHNLFASSIANLSDPNLTPAERSNLTSLMGSSFSLGEVKVASDTTSPTPADATTKTPTAGPGGSAAGPNTCNAPPVLSGVQAVGWSLMCGFNVDAEMKKFADNHFKGSLPDLKSTSLGAMCGVVQNMDNKNPLVYTCRKDSAECMEPKMVRLGDLLPSGQVNGYTGLAFMVGDALYDGVEKVRANLPLRPDTVAVLNGSGWPLYRLINMAAVYPAMAGQLLDAYTSAIAAQYAMDSLDKVARIGAQPGIDMRSGAGLRPEAISVVRENIMNMIRLGNESKNAPLARLAEKRQLVEVIMQVNKTLQAEVIGQGLSGNTALAVSIKRQSKNAAPPKK